MDRLIDPGGDQTLGVRVVPAPWSPGRGAGSHRPAVRKPRRTQRQYLLRGLVFCGVFGRKMQGQWNHAQAHYRCRLASEYALANKVDHPKTVYLRESVVLPHLDRWISSVFDPGAIEETCAQLAAAQGPAVEDVAAAEAARRKLADCDDRLTKHRSALEAGADPTVVTGWISEVQGERLAAERALAAARPSSAALTADELRSLIEGLGDVAAVLDKAKPKERARVTPTSA
jgi:site-specific DNA recombinase